MQSVSDENAREERLSDSWAAQGAYDARNHHAGSDDACGPSARILVLIRLGFGVVVPGTGSMGGIRLRPCTEMPGAMKPYSIAVGPSYLNTLDRN